MNRKGMQLAISTIIVIVLAVVLLIGLIFFLRGGFQDLKKGTEPIIDSANVASVREACELSCINEVRLVYCCQEFEVGDLSLKCDDSRLEVSCELDCAGFSCE